MRLEILKYYFLSLKYLTVSYYLFLRGLSYYLFLRGFVIAFLENNKWRE